MCVALSTIMAFGTFVTITFGSALFQNWFGVRTMLSAYAADMINTEGAIAVNEDAMVADDHTISLENKDGTNTVYIFSEPISFTDASGEIKLKDISVEKANWSLKRQGYDYTNGQNDYRINFSADSKKGLRIEYNDVAFSVIPQDANDVDGNEAVAEILSENFEVFQYKNIYGNGTNLRYYPQLNGVKDEIILNQNINKYAYSFSLETENCTAQINEDGTVSIVDQNECEVQVFEAPYAYDSVYVDGETDEHISDCNYTLTDNGNNQYTLTIHVSKEWLESSATVYPVVIDPTTSHLSENKDAEVNAANPTTNYGSEQTNGVGKGSVHGAGRFYTYFSIPSEITSYATINSASHWERETSEKTTTAHVKAFLVKSSWTESGITWNNKPEYYDDIATPYKNINSASTDKENAPLWYKFDVKNIVQAIVGQGNIKKTNYGMAFLSKCEIDNLTVKRWRTFAARSHSTSAYRPYTVINYTNDTTAPTIVYHCTPTGWKKDGVTISVDDSSYSDTGGSGKSASPYSFSTVAGTYNWGTSTSAFYPTNGTYYLSVRDKAHNIRTYTINIEKIDHLAPDVPTASISPTGWTKDGVSITVQADDADATNNYGKSGVKYYSCTKTAGQYDWKSVSDVNTSYTFTGKDNGTYYIYAKDQVGNISPVNTLTVSNVDKTPPTINSVTGNPEEWTKDNVTLTVNASDAQSGLHTSPYSFSNTQGVYNWQASNNKTFTGNQTVYIYVRDKVGNISAARTVVINKIDKTAPIYNSITLEPSNWTNEDVTLTINNPADALSGLHDLPFSFNNGVSWTDEDSNTYSENTNVTVKIRDKVSNIVTAESVNIDFIDKVDPEITNVNVTQNDTQTSITITASDDASGVSTYSIDGGETWQSENTFSLPNNSQNFAFVSVQDLAGNITDYQNTIELVMPEFYSYDNVVGIYNPVFSSEEAIQYRIGENGTWKTYDKPFEISRTSSTTVFAKFENGTTVISETFTPTGTNSIYAYTESKTDLTVVNNDVSFAVSRDYDSNTNEWTFSTESQAVLSADGKMVVVTLPEGEMLHFIPSGQNEFKDETLDVVLTVDSGAYSFEYEDLMYAYFTNTGRLHCVSGKFDNCVELTYDTNNQLNAILSKVGNETRTYSVQENSNGKIEYIETPIQDSNNIHEKLVYQYTNDGLVKVYYDKDTLQFKRADDIILDEYSYTNSKLTSSNGSTVAYDEDDNYVSLTTPEGETIPNPAISCELDAVVEEEGEPQPQIVYTYFEGTDVVETETTTITYDGITYTTVKTYDINERLLSVCYTSGEESSLTTYTYFGDSDTVHTETVTETDYTSVITHDERGNTVCENVTTPDQESTTTYTYDSWGNAPSVVSTVTENGVTTPVSGTVYEYDDLNRCIKETVIVPNADDEVTLYGYNPLDDVIYEKYDNEISRTLYDQYGRVVQEIESQDYTAADDGITLNTQGYLVGNDSYSNTNVGHRYVYDSTTRLLSQETNRLGVTTNYTYHPNSSVVATETFDMYVLTYNINGKITSSTVNGNTYTTYTYSNNGNPTDVVYSNGQSIHYVYDMNTGNLLNQYHDNDVNNPYVVYDYVPAPENTPIDTGEQLELEENLEVTPNEDYVIKHKTNYDSNRYYTYYNTGKVEVAKADNTNTVIYSYKATNAEDNSSTTVSGVIGNKEYSVVTTSNSITNTYDSNVFSAESTVNDTTTTTDVKVNNTTSFTVTETENETSDVKSYGSNLTFTDNYNNSNKLQISSKSNGTNTTSYQYYPDGQLHIVTGTNYNASYTYDSRGNLTEKTVNNVTTNYGYTNDRLMSVNNTPLSYDDIGNLLTYGNRSYTWSSGRNLASITEGENSYSYSYNKYGYRISKTVNGVTTDFNVAEDGTVVSQSDGTNTLYFEYAEDGTPLAFVLNDTQYLYITNNSGDVMAIADSTGSILATYSYDEWGKVTVNATGDENFALANLNPLRYRGYYYDNETDYYYLQSRYYDPNICQFISPDLLKYVRFQKDQQSGINCYIYCCNNPIIATDDSGHISFHSIYIFYDSKNFVNQAKDLREQYRKYDKLSIVKLISISSKSQFIYKWNEDIFNNPVVFLIFHGSPEHIYTGENFKNEDVESLKNHDIKRLNIYACNCAHKDVKNNIAKKMKKHLTKTKKLYAMDGNISYYLPFVAEKGPFIIRLSKNQDGFKKWRKGKRLPSGLIKVN